LSDVNLTSENGIQLKDAQSESTGLFQRLGLTTTLFLEANSANVTFKEKTKADSSSKPQSEIQYTGDSGTNYGLQVGINGISASFKFAKDGGIVKTSEGDQELSNFMNTSGTFINFNYRLGQFYLTGNYGNQKGFYVSRIDDNEAFSLTLAERFHESLRLRQIMGSVYYFFNDKFDIDSIVNFGLKQESSAGSAFVYSSYDDLEFSADKEFLPMTFSEKWKSISRIRGLTSRSLTINGGYIYNYKVGALLLTGAAGSGFGAGKISIQTTDGSFSRGKASQQPIIHVNVLLGLEYNFDNSFIGMRAVSNGPNLQLNDEITASFPLITIRFGYGTRF